MKKKLIVDILLFILMILEFTRIFTGPLIHEIIGIVLLVLVVIHLYLNKNYLFGIFKSKHNLKNIIMLIINILLICLFILTIILGILSSQELFIFLNIGNLTIIKLHKMISYYLLIIVGLHLGVNFNIMFGKLFRHINNMIEYFIELIIIVCGIYSFIKVNFFEHLTGKYGFSIVSGNIIISILEYFSIVMMIGIVMNYIYRKVIRNER
jgi:hypothetical protein